MQWPRQYCQWLLLLLGLCLLKDVCGHLSDPYKLLGVSRSASLQDIRRAYKQLAKEWHPDKNEDPAAEAKFVEIKQAYEILSDPERRKLYDLHGITDEDSVKQKQDYSFYGRFNTDPLDEFFGSHGGRFHFQDHDVSYFHKMSVTARHYEKTLIVKSEYTAQLVLFYTDWCFPCLQAVPAWRKLIDTLEPLGVALATIHAGREAALTRKVGVSTLPELVLILDGNNYLFKEPLGSVHKVTEFIRSKLPHKLVPIITDTNVDNFLDGWYDNRVRALVFERQQQPRLRYLLTAFHFRHRVAFGFVQLKSPESIELQKRYKVAVDMDTVLVFNENTQRPIASVSMQDIPSQTLHHVITTNQYLALPRLSSQSMLEALCPAEWNRPRKRLCVILITGDTNEHDAARQALRQFAQDSVYNAERVRFVYLYHERQTEFVESLTAEGSPPGRPLLRIVIIWRRDTSHIKYEWLEHEWRPEINTDVLTTETTDTTVTNNNENNNNNQNAANNINNTKQRLDEKLNRLLKSSEALSYEAVVKDLLDEHAQSVFSKIVTRLFVTADIVYECLTRDQVLPALSIIATVIFIVGAGYFMAYLVRLEEESIQQQQQRNTAKRNGNNNNEPNEKNTTTSSTASTNTTTTTNSGNIDTDNVGADTLSDILDSDEQRNANTSPTSNSSTRQPPRELYLHELRAEKYNGLVRLLKPGCRTIVLFVDAQSRLQLIPAFHKIVWPYRKNKTLMFAHMSLERGLSWYRELLQLSLPEPRDLNINPRNCVGTVLSLNGHRKYFCMFHAKHSESSANKKKNKTRKVTNSDDPELGAFIGFESDTTESDDDEILLQGTLLDGLPNWLDRLFEGTTRRYYINYWPDFPTK